MGIPDLIESITPLYNYYKQNQKDLSGTDSLIIMWDIGDKLKVYIDTENVAPHTLFRMIYGKSEGSKNIQQKSYITREFQGRCYRIRNMFSSKDEIIETLPGLKHFTLFREAMPFFDNEKYLLTGPKKTELLKLLNSNTDYSKASNYIKGLQKSHIQKRNPRTQRLDDLESEKKVFVELYNSVYTLLKEPTNDQVSLNGLPSKDQIRIIANNTNAISQDGLKFNSKKLELDSVEKIWIDYVKLLDEFMLQSNAKIVRRFRRIIPPDRIVRLTDMLFELSKRF